MMYSKPVYIIIILHLVITVISTAINQMCLHVNKSCVYKGSYRLSCSSHCLGVMEITSYNCHICQQPSGLGGVCGPCSLDLPQVENLREEVEDIPEYFLWPCHNCHLAAWCHWDSEACPFCMEPRQHNFEINISHPGPIEE